ncbi:MAG: hypothetical protein IPP35_10210 [Elusimicrobia bacterium]|nr:hypothetical protein [Elusimicrobiota bacterium]
MLEVNDHIFGSPREMLCVGLALAIHIPLYFWKAMPDAGPMGDPIAEIEFKIDQAETETPAPPPKEEKKEEVSFFQEDDPSGGPQHSQTDGQADRPRQAQNGSSRHADPQRDSGDSADSGKCSTAGSVG